MKQQCSRLPLRAAERLEIRRRRRKAGIAGSATRRRGRLARCTSTTSKWEPPDSKPCKAPTVKIPGREALGSRLALGKGSGSCARVVTFAQPKEPARPLVVRPRESAPRARNALLCGPLPRERPATGDSAPRREARYVIPLRSLPAGRPLRTVPRRPKPGRRTGVRQAQDARDPRSLRRGGSVAA